MKAKTPIKLLGSLILGLPILATSVAAENSGGWEYSIAPLYVWGKSVEGKSAVGPTESELDLSFTDDILENLDAAAAVHLEAKQGPLVFFGEYNYAKLDPSTQIDQGSVSIKGEVEFTDILWEVGFRYEVADTGATQWEVLGGVRGLDQELDITLKRVDDGASVGTLPRTESGGDDWWHGFGGARVTTKLSDHWHFVARGDYGYKNSDNQSYMLEGIFDYRFNDWGSFFVGYRHLELDYANKSSGADNYATDTANSGPLLGLNIYF